MLATDSSRTDASPSAETTPDTTGGPADPHPWRAAILLTVLVVGAAAAWSMWLEPLKWGVHRWLPPGDAWPTLTASHYVANGALGYVYEANRAFVATPLFPILLSPVAAMGEAFKLTQNDPFVLPHPSIWPLYVTYAVSISSLPLLYAVRALATEMGLRRGRLLLQALTAALCLVPVDVVFGHYEDVLALAFVLLSIRALNRNHSLQAAFLLGLGIASKQWAILALPIVLVQIPRGRRIRAGFVALAVPGTLVGAALALDGQDAARAMLRPASSPHLGYAAFWVNAHAHHVVGTGPRSMLFLLALALALLIKDRADIRRTLAVLGICLGARIFVEPVAYVYYLGPGLTLLLLHERLASRRVGRTVIFGLGLLALFLWHPSLIVWWGAAGVLAALLLVPAAVDLFRPIAGVAASGHADITQQGPLGAAGRLGLRWTGRPSATRSWASSRSGATVSSPPRR